MYWKIFLLANLVPLVAPSAAAGKNDACSAFWQLFHLAIVSSHWLAEQKNESSAKRVLSALDTDQGWRGRVRDTSRRRPAAAAAPATAAPASHSSPCQTRLRTALPCSSLLGCLKRKSGRVKNEDGGSIYFRQSEIPCFLAVAEYKKM